MRRIPASAPTSPLTRSVHPRASGRPVNSAAGLLWGAAGAAILALSVGVAPLARGQASSVQKCDICHGKPDFRVVLTDGRVKYLYVDGEELASSVHAKQKCEDCHADVTEIPHPPGVERVNCSRCHFEGSAEGIPQTGGYKDYSESVHGREVKSGNSKAPLCQDCHGAHGIYAPADSASWVYKAHVPKVCGACHLQPYADYRTSVHGIALLDEGNFDAPSCADCHGEHKILRHTVPGSSVYATNIGRTCAHCHAAEGIMGKYGIETAQVETYKESYHGIAGKFGVKTVANCASCHGVHDIRPPEDPRSLVHISNIPTTCGKCHRGANPNFARGKIHVQPKSKESGAVYYVASAFKWLTITVICGLVVHIILDFNRKRRARRRPR